MPLGLKFRQTRAQTAFRVARITGEERAFGEQQFERELLAIMRLPRRFVENLAARDQIVERRGVFGIVLQDVAQRALGAVEVLLGFEHLGEHVHAARVVGRRGPQPAGNVLSTREIAGFIPTVQCESLDSSDDRWAEVALELLQTSRAPDARQAMRKTFEASPFTISRAVADHTAIFESS